MASNGGLRAFPLRQDYAFNWIFLVTLVVCGILTLFFLFYFNRLFATLISYGIRAWTWHRYRVYIDIQALQISLLGGRVFFKGVRYHGNNETILVHTGYITWCYWLRNVRELNLDKDEHGSKEPSIDTGSENVGDEQTRTLNDAEGGGSKKEERLPCRLNVSIHGAEWFVYNRSAAYDAIVAGLSQDIQTEDTKSSEPAADSPESKLRKRNLRPKLLGKTLKRLPLGMKKSASILTAKDDGAFRNSNTTTETRECATDDVPQSATRETPFILKFLPIHIDCQKAAVVLGNENTKSVLVTKAERVSGEVDATKSSNPCDQYKQLFNFEFEHPVVQMKPNDDYKEDQTAAAIRVKQGTPEQQEPKKPRIYSHSYWHRQRRRVWHALQDLIPKFRSSVESFSTNELHPPHNDEPNSTLNWQGLSRYLEEGEKDDRARWSSIEYATVSTIVDSPKATMSFFWDVAGSVREIPAGNASSTIQKSDNINGDTPPEWGLNILIEGGVVNYGPWADRQRAELQRVFFPSLCKDSVPAKSLGKGETRVPSKFKVYIEMEKETTLRVPIREESKNWKWAKQVDTIGAQDTRKKGNKVWRRKADKGDSVETRPFGWLDVKVGSNATVSYVMDMLAGETGFVNDLQLDLPSVEVTTSVNHGLLMKSAGTTLSCDLSNPLKWNGSHTWTFDIDSKDLELFILREHVFLFIDLVDDWASGPPPEYLTFSPFTYVANLKLRDFKLYLNVNDANIINNPSDFDDNTFISIFGCYLNANIQLPLISYRPHRTDISFNIDAHDGGLKLHTPPWNTQATFLTTNVIATLRKLLIDGKYQYCATTSTANTDTLILNVYGDSPTAQLYGFVIRYYLKIKDNYFGDDIRFKTLEEYQEILRGKRDGKEDSQPQQPIKVSNDLDVIMSVNADNTHAILPANLYSSKHHTDIEIASLAVDLRFTNYYMDLDVVFQTLAFSQGNESDGSSTPNSGLSSTQLFIDGINIYGNRLFGLPPTEPTYICNWDFSIGAVTGECGTEFISRLVSGGKSVAFSFDDDENALPLIFEDILHDTTFLRAHVESVQVWLHVEDIAFLFSTGSISVNFNDWADSRFSSRVKLYMPDLRLACVDAESASRHRSRVHQSVVTHMLLQTTIRFTMMQRKFDFAKERQLQQEHLKTHDQRTNRSGFLLAPQLLGDGMLESVDAPAMSVPSIPVPILNSHLGADDGRSSTSSTPSRHRVRRQSSFLSISTASQTSDSSVLRPRSPKKVGVVAVAESRAREMSSQEHTRTLRPRDISASTGRPSSFYSAVGESRGVQQSTVTFSSSCMSPYFPLIGIQPDATDLPEISPEDDRTLRHEQTQQDYSAVAGRSDDNTAYISLMLELPVGVRAVLNPEATQAVAKALSCFQAVDPVDILDTLQVESMAAVFEKNKQQTRNMKVTDFHVEAPGISVRFINTSHDDQLAPSRNTHDQYDLSIGRIKGSTRSTTIGSGEPDATPTDDTSAIHLGVETVAISAKERYNGLDDPQAAADIYIQDISFWMATGNVNSVNLGLKGFQVTTSSSRIEYLGSLIHRTKNIADNITDSFSSRLNQQMTRLQLFAYLVVTMGSEAPDPAFLTRPSYVLRSADNHLRSSDSWKVVTRMHHMYTTLSTRMQSDIASRCSNLVDCLPKDAREQVMAMLNQWRSWDLNSVQDSAVMKIVYGYIAELAETDKPIVPVKITFSTRNLRMLLDPGPKQNDISLDGLSAIVEHNSISAVQEHDKRDHGESRGLTIAQVSCPKASVHLNWELFELADDLLRLYLESQTDTPSVRALDSSMEKHSNNIGKHDLHVNVVTGESSVTLDTVNLRLLMASDGLKGSLVQCKSAVDPSLQMTTLILAADATTTMLSSHMRDITLYQVQFPSIFVSHEPQLIDQRASNVFKIAANCQRLSFEVKQEILGILEIVDLVLGDEVRQLHTLQKKLSKPTPSQNIVESKESSEDPSHTKINVALFMDEYNLKLPLLHSLFYEISGTVARLSIAAQLDSEIILDFDVKENVHYLKSQTSHESQNISALHIPPTNGRLTCQMNSTETTISVLASIEPIKFDAAALHGLMSALSRPEISSRLSDVKDDINALQGHIDEIFVSSPKKSTPSFLTETKRLFVYDVHVTWAGLSIYANAHGDQQRHTTSRLDFRLGCVQLVIVNRLDHRGPILEYPELRIGLRDIGLELTRWNGSSMQPCGNLSFVAFISATSTANDVGEEVRAFHLHSDGLEVNLFPSTASSVVDIMQYLQGKIKDLDFSREKKYLRKLRKPKPRITISETSVQDDDYRSDHTAIFGSMYSLELLNIHVSWIVGLEEHEGGSDVETENLVFSLQQVELTTRKENSARLTITDLQLQMVPPSYDKTQRSLNSALLPEVIFNVGYVSTSNARRLAFQAAGKSLDLRLTSQFILPAAAIQKSISSAVEKLRVASEPWTTIDTKPAKEEKPRATFFGTKRMESLLIDADFAGAVVYLSGKTTRMAGSRRTAAQQTGRYGQFSYEDASSTTVLRAPGLAWKIEYKDNGIVEPSLNAEVKVDASNNILYPAVVPLIMEISSTVKDIVSDDNVEKKLVQQKPSPQKFLNVEDDNILAADPSTVLGRTKLNLGLRICRQEFSLSCQPIARVAAVAKFEDIYLTVNTVRSSEHGHFFAASAAFTNLQASVQHVYSRESTGSFNVESVFLSLMNSKHVSGIPGLSAILKISPMKVLVNAKQLQDFLLFREIWIPSEIRERQQTSTPVNPSAHNQTILVHRYQQVAATGAFPWNATISIAELHVQLDLGQAIGRSGFMISNFWLSSKKNSDWEQNLCLGFDKIGIDSSGRMSGFVALQNFKLRTSIRWPAREKALNQTPLVQASLAFSQFRVKAAFDYQAFLVADITSFEFLMYNVRNEEKGKGDRLVATLDGEAVQLFCTTTSASQALAVYQAFQRLVQEKRSNYEASLAEVDKFMKRKSIAQLQLSTLPKPHQQDEMDKAGRSPITLHTDVIVTLKALNVGAFPNTFTDQQIFKLEALNAQARFAVTMDEGKIRSVLGLTLGQLRIGLAGVKQAEGPKTVGELSVEDVVQSATGSRGGTILKVPKVEAVMQTWQMPGSNHIDYIFKSSFEGKVEVGWNYSRISYIRNMWASHSKALAQRLGKPLPPSAVKITGVPGEENSDGEQQKITAEVNVPLSKYDYTALEPPIIETPQLRDMGEATPPLEWIGLHRDRLPNLTHQIVIVTLMEVASEVEEAYGKILGST